MKWNNERARLARDVMHDMIEMRGLGVRRHGTSYMNSGSQGVWCEITILGTWVTVHTDGHGALEVHTDDARIPYDGDECSRWAQRFAHVVSQAKIWAQYVSDYRVAKGW